MNAGKNGPVFVIATDNNKSDFPPELLRKGWFDEIFFVDLLAKDKMINIFQIHLVKYGQQNITDYAALAEKSKYFNTSEI